MQILTILLQAQGQPQGGGMGGMLWLLIAMVLIIWLMGGSQRKQAKKEQQFREQLKKGDRVVFGGGIYGKVMSVEATTAEVEVSNGVLLTVEKSTLQPVPAQQTKQEPKADAKK